MHAYEVRARKDKRGVDLISDVLLFGRASYDDQGKDSRFANGTGSSLRTPPSTRLVDKIGGQQEFSGFVQTAFVIGKTGS
jgi:hypothetical protein